MGLLYLKKDIRFRANVFHKFFKVTFATITMCGINGFNFKNKKVIKRMNESIRHRGPDDSGEFFSKKISLGHRRLSIIDLSKKGTQPMEFSYKNKKIQIVYNGEIFNYKEIKMRLQKKGYIFKNNTDTEVVLASYLEWGEKCVEKFNGMWAFCIYDSQKNNLFLSRDRLGEKPLYYYYSNGKFIFSSEIKSILTHNIKIEIDKESVDLFFSLGFIPAPYTIYKDIHKLEQGFNMIFNLKSNQFKKKRYYNLPKYNPVYNKKKLIDEFKSIFEDATKIRMMSEVPLGTFLSGGVDSSIVVNEINNTSKNQLHTFSVEMEGCNDVKYVKILRDSLNLKNSIYKFDKKEFERINGKIFNFFDEPYADYSMYPTFFLFENASKHIRVGLSGDGADEHFGGYDHYKSALKISRLKKMPKLIRRFLMSAMPKNSKTFLIREGLRVSLLKDEDFFSSAWDDIYKPKIFTKICREKMGEMLILSGGNLVEAMMLFDKHFKTMGNNFLYRVDQASMASALEVRSPFLDYRFSELASKIPTKWKINLSSNKILMKEAIKEDIPIEIINRRKEGFNSDLLPKLIKEMQSTENLKIIISELSSLKILSKEWETFFIKTVLKSEDGRAIKYRLRLILFYEWFKVHSSRIDM